MRIGEINKENYAEYLKIFGGTNTKTLDNLWGKDKETGNTKRIKTKEEVDAYQIESGYVMEGMMVKEGDTSHHKIVPVSNDMKTQIYELVKREYVENKGMTDGEDFRALTKDYIKNSPVDKRLSVAWTIDQIWIEEAERIDAYIKERQPGWQAGKSFDPHILDGYISGSGVDISV